MLYSKGAGIQINCIIYNDNREIMMQVRLLGRRSRKRRMGLRWKEGCGFLLVLWELGCGNRWVFIGPFDDYGIAWIVAFLICR